MTSFTYVVLKYVHDNVAGETLNIGVLLVAPELGYVDCRLDFSVARFTAAFSEFNVRTHRAVLRDLRDQVRAWRRGFDEGQLSLIQIPDASTHIRWIWPDRGLNYQASESRAGNTDYPSKTLDSLFDRFVTRQSPDRHPRQRQDDSDVWKEVSSHLPLEISTKFSPTDVHAGPFTFRFGHTYGNGCLHVVEPLSFDLLEADSVRDKSLRWMGYAHHLKPYIGSLRLVVAGPKDLEVRGAYESALEILSGATRVYETNQTDQLRDDLEMIMT